MADLTGIQATEATKIVGSDGTGNEQTPVQSTTGGALHANLRNNAGTEVGSTASPLDVRLGDGSDTAAITANGEQKMVDGLRNGGVNGALTLTTAGTTYEAKVGASRLTNRKSLIITIQSAGVFWGYSSTVTTSTGQPTSNGQVLSFSIDPDSTFQIWLVCTTNNKVVIIAESP